MKKNIGFIGVGNMSSAIIRGITNSFIKNTSEIYGYDHDPRDKFAKLNATDHVITQVNSIEELVSKSDIIFIGVKPDNLKDIADKLVTKDKNKIFVSMVGGVSLDQLSQLLPNKKIVRIMPNVNASVQKATTAIAFNDLITDEEKDFTIPIINSFGSTFQIDNENFELFAAISGSSPAVVFLLIDAMANSSVKYGMTKKDAIRVVTDMILGSATLMQKTIAENPDMNARNLIDLVCSPKGTTIQGILSLEENKFESSIDKAIDAMMNKK